MLAVRQNARRPRHTARHKRPVQDAIQLPNLVKNRSLAVFLGLALNKQSVLGRTLATPRDRVHVSERARRVHLRGVLGL